MNILLKALFLAPVVMILDWIVGGWFGHGDDGFLNLHALIVQPIHNVAHQVGISPSLTALFIGLWAIAGIVYAASLVAKLLMRTFRSYL